MKIIKTLFFIFLGIVIITSIKTYFYSEWTFTNRLYYNLFWALHYSSCVLCIFSLITIFLKYTTQKIISSLTAITISYFIFHIQFNPIDTSEYPIDKKTIAKNHKEKTVIREMTKGKSSEITQDTVRVEDIFIFRRIL